MLLNIQCPSCKKPMQVDNGDLEVVQVQCPYCDYQFPVQVRKRPVVFGGKLDNLFGGKQQQPAQQPGQPVQQPVQQPVKPIQQTVQQPVQQPKPKVDSHHTILGNNLAKGTPVLVFNGKSYKLSMGHNTVGRKSPTTTATLQIPTDDMHMSRTNAVIEVAKTATGEWRVLVSSVNERNLVHVNQNVLEIGDLARLQPGYVLKMGHSLLVFNLE